MPKAKPTQVIVHRIELQEKERDLAAAAIAGNFAGKAIQAAGVGAGAIVAYMGVKAAYGITGDFVEGAVERFKENNILSKENRERQRAEREAAGYEYDPLNPPDDFWEKTFHFWTGGLFL